MVATLARERRSDTPGVGWYEPLEWVLVRSPLLPVERYAELRSGTDSEAGLPQAVRDPVVRRAIAVASPSLFERLGRPPSSPSALRRWRLAVLRYLIRMSTRPTPYGLNAAVSLAGWGAKTDLELGSGEVVRARLDMGLLDALIGELESRPEVVRQLRLETHPTVTVRAGRAFLPERLAGGSGAFEVSVRATRPVLRALDFCRAAPVPFAEIAEALGEEFPDAGPRIVELIHTLVREGLLVTELRPPLTRGDPAGYLLSRLDRISAARAERARLAAAIAACERWEGLDAADAAERFPALRLTAQAVPAAPPEEAPVRVDMMRPLNGERITRAVGEEAARAAELLLRISPLHAGSVALNSYRDRFLERYPAPTEVPLMELIQPDLGLGPPSLRGNSAGERTDEDTQRRNRRLLEIATSALHADELSVELDRDVIADLETALSTKALPPTVELGVFVAAGSREALDAGEFRVVVSPLIGSYAAGKILGRFAYLFDGRGERAMAEAARRQEAGADGSLCAELVYGPERPWLSNVTIRPATRRHEIVVGVAPGVPRDDVIPLSELVVGVHDEAFYLRWPKRGMYVEVCEGHMLNPAAAPAVCAFLAEMGRAGRPVLTSFQWGAARELPRLPRVEMGRIVLSAATWRPPFGIGGVDPDSSEGFASTLESWGARWRLPRRVFMAQGDNRLLLDLDDHHQVELLRGLVRSTKHDTGVLLQESLPGIEDAWLPGPGGGFLIELAVPLARDRASLDGSRSDARRPPAGLVPPAPQARLRAPGSEWLYAKVYTGGTIADQLVVGPLAELVHEALGAGLAEDWFFIRYRDERPHLRVRFRGEPDRLTGELMPRLSSWASDLMDRGTCQSFTLDTYERELERYGGEQGMRVAEAVFGVDSSVVVELIRLELSRAITVPRELLGVLTLDCLLEGLGLDSEDRVRWCATHVPSRHDVTSEWRENKNELRSLLGSGARENEPLGPLLEGFTRELRPHGERLAALRAEGAVEWPSADDVLASFAHMHCNRLLGLDRDAERRALGLLQRTRESLARAPVG